MVGLRTFLQRYTLRLLGLILLALLGGSIAYAISEEMGLAEVEATGTHRLDLYSASLDREIDKYAYFPATLGLERDVISLLSAGDVPSEDVNEYLEQLNNSAGTLVIYVLNRAGHVVASSNWRRPDSFIGEDLSYRPYFVAASQGENGRFFGIGTTRNEPGYYLSSPLLKNNAIVGVAVVKVSLEDLEQSWATVEAPVLVSDENGVVILASVPSWKFTTVRPMDNQQRQYFEQTLQYNARLLSPLGLIEGRKLNDTARIVRLHHQAAHSMTSVFPVSGAFIAQSTPLRSNHWTMTVLSPIKHIDSMALTRALVAASGMALLYSLLLLWYQRRQHLHAQIKARQALQQAHDELERKVEERTRTLQAAQDELVHAGKMAVVGQLSAGLAHELNQPLAALRTLSGNTIKFMERGDLTSAQGNLDRIAQLVDTMGALTSQLKSFARKSSGAPQPVDIRRALDNALFLLEQRLRHTAVTPSVHFAAPRLLALCDPIRLEQVLVNLVGNALDALQNHPSPRLTISASHRGEQILLTVHDNGPGLSDEAQKHLFEPFFTTKDLPAGKEGGGGLGLGLAISAGIVRDFGGSLLGENHPGGGAVFLLHLPAAPAETMPHV